MGGREGGREGECGKKGRREGHRHAFTIQTQTTEKIIQIISA